MPNDDQQPMSESKHLITLGGGDWNIAKYGAAEFLRKHPLWRALTGILAVISVILMIMGLIHLPAKWDIPTFTIFFFISPTLFWLATVSGPHFRIEFPQAKASQEKETAEKRFEETRAPGDALTLDFARLNEYYLINQAQARSSFRWTIFSMSLGLATIVAGIWIFYFRTPQPDKFMASLATAAGVVVDLIGGLFLFLHTKTQDRSLYYFQQLAHQKRIMMAMRLVEEFENEGGKTAARNLVIQHLLSEGSTCTTS